MNNQTANTEEPVYVAVPVKDYKKEIAIAVGAGILLIIVVGFMLRKSKGKIGLGDVMAQMES